MKERHTINIHPNKDREQNPDYTEAIFVPHGDLVKYLLTHAPLNRNAMVSQKKENYETLLAELTSLVNELENGEKSLDEALKIFEQGVKLTKSVQEKLQLAEQKVQVLTDAHGQSSIEADDEENCEK